MMREYNHGGEIYGKDIRLDYSVNMNPLGMPERVRRAAKSAVTESFRYPDDSCRELRQAIAGAKGLEADRIICGNGASDLIYRYAWAVKARRVLIPAPAFSEYERAFALAGAEIIRYPLRETDGFRLDEGIFSAAESADVTVLCSPDNPVGRLADRELLLKLLGRAEARGKRLFLDECFMELAGFGKEYSLLSFAGEHRGLFVLCAFTKTYAMAGLRLGYGVTGDEELLACMRAAGAPWSVSVVAQKAGIAALGETEYLSRAVELIKKERHYLAAGLAKLGCTVYPSQANYILFREEEPLYERLLSQRILIRQCGNYAGLDGSYYRICVGLHRDNEELLKILQGVLEGDSVWQR